MGADMLIASIGYKRGQSKAKTDKNIKTMLNAATEKIKAALSIKELDESGCTFPGGEEGAEALNEAKEMLLEDLKEVSSALLGYHRQAAWIAGGSEIEVLVSGGLSWGDDPTELYAAINRLQSAGVINDARYPKET